MTHFAYLVALLISVSVLAFQSVQWYGVWQFTRRWVAEFQKLAGVDVIPEALARQSPWLGWLAGPYQKCRSPAGAESLGRDDVLGELDDWLAAERHLLRLHRTAVVAPLIGVVITVVGFWWLPVNTSEKATLGEILVAVRPLYLGIFAGAVLAIWNQVILHSVSLYLDGLRGVARGWFDEWVGGRAGAGGKVAEALDRLSKTVTRVTRSQLAFAQRVLQSAEQIEEATARCKESTGQLAAEVLEFRGRIESLGASIEQLHSLGTGLRKARRGTLRTIRDLSAASAKIVGAVEGDFALAAEKHRESVDAQARAAESFQSAAQALAGACDAVKAGSSTLRESAEAHNAASTGLDRSFKEDLLPAVRIFRKAVNQVGSAAETLGASPGKGSGRQPSGSPSYRPWWTGSRRRPRASAFWPTSGVRLKP